MEDETDESVNLEFVADEIRRYYVELGKFVPSNVRVKDKLIEAAQICIKVSAAPKDFVAAQVASIGKDNMQLNFLAGPGAAERYTQFMEKRQLSVEDSYDVQMMYLKAQITQAKRTVEQALMDDDIGLHPWFRICITKEPNTDVIDKYLAEAKTTITPKIINFLKTKKLDYTRITNG